MTIPVIRLRPDELVTGRVRRTLGGLLLPNGTLPSIQGRNNLAGATGSTGLLSFTSSGGGSSPVFAFNPAANGLSLIAQTEFNSGSIGGAVTDGFSYYGDGSFVQNPAASIQTPPNVYRTSYPEGSAGDGAGGSTIEGDNGLSLKRIYGFARAYFSPNYVVHDLNGSEKFWYPVVRQVGGGVITSSAFTIGYPDSPTSGNIRLHLGPQTDRGPQSIDQAAGPYIIRGQINTVEWYSIMNTPGLSDGVWQSWINGQLVVDRADINYGNGVNAAWVGPRFTGTRGGGASSVLVPAGGMYRDYDLIGCWGAAA